MDVYSAIVNLNTVLILLATGLVVWIVRQLIPDAVEGTGLWRVALRILPILVGVGIALIPGLRPMENLAQSVVVGGVAGSFSSSTYELARELLGEKMRAVMGSPQKRKRDSIVNQEVTREPGE